MQDLFICAHHALPLPLPGARLIVLHGDCPGAGKSALMRHVAYMLSDDGHIPGGAVHVRNLDGVSSANSFAGRWVLDLAMHCITCPGSGWMSFIIIISFISIKHIVGYVGESCDVWWTS